jgi:hypothetical protein
MFYTSFDVRAVAFAIDEPRIIGQVDTGMPTAQIDDQPLFVMF